jgi:F1F0 ATPase subunit 2
LNDWLFIVLSLAAGGVLGCFFFGGLWITVRRLPTARHPAVLMLGSFFGRSAILMLGFYLVAAGRWEQLVACLVGFFIARQLMFRRYRPGREDPKPVSNEVSGV